MLWYHWAFIIMAILGIGSFVAAANARGNDEYELLFLGFFFILIIPVVLGFIQMWKTVG